MSVPIRWGILSAGRIADHFTADLRKTPDTEIIAVAARSLQRATAFAAKHHIPHAYGSYAELATDPNIDVIYVATTHNFHKEHTLLCLENGKHVLCEKPFALNAVEANQMIACAQSKKLFLMEAMWSRFNPAYQRAMHWIQNGLIGEVRMLKADFGFRAPWEPEQRILNPVLGAGRFLTSAFIRLPWHHSYWAFSPPTFRRLPIWVQRMWTNRQASF